MSGRLNFVKRWENTVAGHDSTAMSYMTVKTMNSIELKHLIAVVHENKSKSGTRQKHDLQRRN